MPGDAGLCLLVALAAAKHCEYGSLPGHIVISSTNTFPLQWEQLDPECTTKEELNKYFGIDPTGQAAVNDRNISFLIYGDASDGFMAKDICEVIFSRYTLPSCTMPQFPQGLVDGCCGWERKNGSGDQSACSMFLQATCACGCE